jgi:hypothetical protein
MASQHADETGLVVSVAENVANFVSDISIQEVRSSLLFAYFHWTACFLDIGVCQRPLNGSHSRHRFQHRREL